MGDLNSRVAHVTGAGSGIGRAIALRLAADGATVVVTDIDIGKAASTAKDIVARSGRAAEFALDVASPEAVRSVFTEIERRYGQVALQVSHAGITTRLPILHMSLEVLDPILRTNLYGVVLCGQAAARLMRQRGGRLVK